MSGATVVVPVFNSLHVVRPCVESVVKWTDLSSHRLLLVDDGSDQRTADQLDEWALRDDGVEVMRNPRNLGFVRTCNRVFGEVRTGLVVLLNSDTCVTPRWLDKIVACFESDDRIGVASPISNFSPHNTIPLLPGMDYLQMAALVERLSDRSYPDVTTPEGFCFAMSEACRAVVGDFDLAFGDGYGEESDFAMRAVFHGFRTVCVDDTYVYHEGRGTFGEGAGRRLRLEAGRVFHSRWGEMYRDLFEEFQERDPLKQLRRAVGEQARPGVEPAVVA
jgi:GT2 family glycosyltransferase